MKTKALAFILSLCLCFSAISFTILAEDVESVAVSTNELSVEDEIKANIPSFDPDLYPLSSDVSCHILGIMEQGLISEKSPKLFVYIYNPSGIQDLVGDMRLTVSLHGKEDIEIFQDLYVNLYHSRHSDDNRFVILEVRLEYFLNKSLFQEYAEKHTYKLDELCLSGFRSNGSFYYSTFEKCEIYDFTLNDDSTYQVTVDKTDLAQLDVESTTYKVPYANASNAYEHDTIYSVYFSVPDEYMNYYNSIYSVTSSYNRNYIKNLVISNHPSLSGKNFHSFYKEAIFHGDGLTDYNSNLHNCLYYFGRGSLHYYNDNTPDILHFGSFLNSYITYYSNLEGNFIMDAEQTEKMISHIYLKDQYVNWDMGQLSSYPDDPLDLYILTDRFEASTKTIDQTWDAVSYYTSSDFTTYWEDFGFFTAYMAAFYKNTSNNKKLKELYEKYGFVPDDIEDEPYLVKIDAVEELKINSLTDEEVANNYLIRLKDVPSFREYLEVHDNVLLYRFDIQPYFCYDLEVYSYTDGDRFDGYLTRFYWYDDFEVIELTFKDGDEYISSGVTHDALFIAPDIEFIPKDDGIDTIGGLKRMAQDFSSVFKLIGIILGIVALVVLILFILKLFNPLRESIQNRKIIKAIKDNPSERPKKRRRKRD